MGMCKLSWTPPLLEKDNSKNNPVYNRVYSSLSGSQYRKEMKGKAGGWQVYNVSMRALQIIIQNVETKMSELAQQFLKKIANVESVINTGAFCYVSK